MTRTSPTIRLPRRASLPPPSPSFLTSRKVPKPITRTLRLVLFLLVFYYEYYIWRSATHSCAFITTPGEIKPDSFYASGSAWAGLPGGGTTPVEKPEAEKIMKEGEGIGAPFKLLLVSDPQILDMRSYPGRNWALRWLGVYITDAWSRRAWSFVVNNGEGASNGGEVGASAEKRRNGPDAVAWVGDLMDSGVLTLGDERECVEPYLHLAIEWQTDDLPPTLFVRRHETLVTRFRRLFPPPRTSSYSTSFIPVIHLAGNHDLGLHLSPEISNQARMTFLRDFGPLNGVKRFGGKVNEGEMETERSAWEVVWIDSMALLEGGRGFEMAKKFIDGLGPPSSPRILLSHIPLFRPEGTSCGSLRESSRTLRQGTGVNYQNELDEKTSQWLLESIRPVSIYSGDDHDSCTVTHSFASSPTVTVQETTLKAFSMAMGIRRPGYLLLSLFPPSSNPTRTLLTQNTCLLPDQLSIWLSIYAPLSLLLLLSFFLAQTFGVFYRLYNRRTQRRRINSARSNGLPVHVLDKNQTYKSHGYKHSRSRSIFAGVVEAASLVGEGVAEKRKKVGRREKKWSRTTDVYDALRGEEEEGDYDDEADETEAELSPTAGRYVDRMRTSDDEEGNGGFSFGSLLRGAGGNSNDDYYSGINGEHGPTRGGGSPNGGMGKVRRVSRVWLWEAGRDGRTPSSNNVLRGRSTSRGRSNCLPRSWVRGLMMLMRVLLFVTVRNPLVKGLITLGGFARGGFTRRVIADTWDVLWVGLVTWFVVLFWFQL